MRITDSICPVCLKKIKAKIVEDGNKILIKKECPKHGSFSSLHWQSSRIYDLTEEWDLFDDSKMPEIPSECPYSCGLCESHISRTVIGVIDVTKRCDLDCPICFANFSDSERDYEPSRSEIANMLKFLADQRPKPPAVLFSGGEPLLRKDLHEIVQMAHKLGFMTILATNGIKIAENPEIAHKLKKNGLKIVYLQFDGLNDVAYQKMRGRDLLKDKLRIIEICRKYDIEIILVPTLIRDVNSNEVGDIIKFAAKNSDIIRGVVFQPIAFTGRASFNPLRDKWTDWKFAEEVEQQTNGEIQETDLLPVSIMSPPIKIMKRFMEKPWPLFSCSPHCGIVNWIYVSKNFHPIPINHFLDFEGFFERLVKLSHSIEEKSKATIALSLLLAAVTSLNWKLVHREIGVLKVLKTILRMHVSPSYASLGDLRRRIFLLGNMAFMDRYNFDINRARRCVIHFVTPDLKIIPFCAYNNIHRVGVEQEYASKSPMLKKANPSL